VSSRQEVDLPARGTREQRQQHTGNEDDYREGLRTSEHIADLLKRDLLRQIVNGKGADGEANADLYDFAYDCTTS
jgi:hypothetical protein